MVSYNVPGAEDIAKAHQRIQPYIHRTPILSSQSLNEITGARLFFKCENFQKAGAFKSRGACNAVFSLKENELQNGVCTHSSGNHAQALARAARLRGIRAYIVMPSNAPAVKVEAVKNYGGEITFCLPTLAAREETLQEVVSATGAKEIHPYNDPVIISGQATAAREAFEECNDPDYILAPVGGGGLLSGTALATAYYSENTLVLGAEPQGADDAYRSLQAGMIVPSLHPKTIADGLLTSLGTHTFPIIRDYVNGILTVSESSILQAMKLIWERMKMITEPSGAVPLAAILENPHRFEGKKVILIISGGNVDLDSLPFQSDHP